MDFRPDYFLDRLRMMTALETDPSTEGATGSLTAAASGNNGRRLHLRWLRTIVVDLHFTEKKIASTEKFALIQRSVSNGAVGRIMSKELGNEHVPYLESLVKSLFGVVDGLPRCSTRLTCLDLRGCDNRHPAWHSFWSMMTAEERSSGGSTSSSIASSLQRLFLPRVANVTQATLNHFVQLEELDATCCKSLTTVDFCCKTLRVLYADCCTNLTNEGLKNATRLTVLHVSCSSMSLSAVQPFQHCLVELDCSGDCGIDSAALSDCYRLQVLRARQNDKITTLLPFAGRLRELSADGWNSKLDDAALVPATGLVQLSVDRNETITTVAPCAASLRDLCASSCLLDDTGLTAAVNLVRLNVSENVAIRSLAPFAHSLLELDATSSGLEDDALSAATQLMSLTLNSNELISTLHGNRSLRHLTAWGSALTDEGLRYVTQLTTFQGWEIPKVTTISPFRDSLQELSADSEHWVAEVQLAPNVYRVSTSYMDSKAMPQAYLAPLGFEPLVMETRHSVWHRETATHHYLPPEKNIVF